MNSEQIPFYKDAIPICFASNDYFVPYMATMMQSVMENSNPDRRYAFYVLYADISSENMQKCQSMVSRFTNFTIDFVDVGDFFDKQNLFVSEHISVEAYFRLVIPYLFADYEKVIYLDGDMICLTDVAELYEIDIESNVLAAVRDTVTLSRYYSGTEKHCLSTEFLNLQKPENYFNSGLLVVNISEFNRTIDFKSLIDYAQSQNFKYHDQDVFNSLFEGKVKLISYSWNFQDGEGYKYLPQTLRDEYIASRDEIKIVHYISEIKPWAIFYYIHNFEYFWRYASRTPFIDIIIQRMESKRLIRTNRAFTVENYINEQQNGITKSALKLVLRLICMIKKLKIR
jgi:lipopolysaccharide biosynthesis glycosyltransferase